MWFSIYDFSFDYKGDETPFTNPYSFKWAIETESRYADIKKELEEYLNGNELKSYFNTSMVTQKNSWKTISLTTWGIEMFKVKKHFPKTCTILEKYPEIISASFSMLEPHSKIVPHCGDTNAIYRCHLGIDVPAGLPLCGLKVKDESKAWENGKWFAFMDAYKHEAWNDTDKPRYVFILDTMRDEFAGRKKYVCATVRTSLFLQKRFNKLTSMPVFAKVSATLLRPLIQMGIFLVNTFKIY
jgi:aspartyl/asparaginyl beta-hydroxylase (cupin superfamily)